MALSSLQEIQQKVKHSLGSPKAKGYSGWKGIALRGEWNTSDESCFNEDNYTFQIQQAQSLLDIRCILQKFEESSKQRAIIFINFDTTDFPGDIKSRLLLGSIQEVDSWQMVLSRFDAFRCDTRIPNSPEIVNVLLQYVPLEGYEKSTAGFLSTEQFWNTIIHYVFSLRDIRVDSPEMLIWAAQDENQKRLSSLHEEVHKQTRRWVHQKHPLTQLVFDLIRLGIGKDVIPLGLIAGVVFNTDLQDQVDIAKAQVRFEQMIDRDGHTDTELKVYREWQQLSEVAIASLNKEDRERLLNRSDKLVESIGIQKHSGNSSWLLSGYSERIKSFADACHLYIQGSEDDSRMKLTFDEVKLHRRTQESQHRIQRMEMLIKLLRWLKTEDVDTDDLLELSRYYKTNLSYTDWARNLISGGDSIPELQELYGEVSKLCLERREVFNEKFARVVNEHRFKHSKNSELKRIDRVLDEVVVPVLQAEQKCLVLVMDGMSWAVANELLPHFEADHWTLRKRSEWEFQYPSVITTIPSVTEYGRMSLLTGSISKGHQAEEKLGFSEHQGLKKAIERGPSPTLFHKNQLENKGRTGLTEEVRSALTNIRQKVIGIVINSIDDHLAKDDMKLHRWDVNNIRLLPSILEAAKEGRRTIIVCSDHGHIDGTWTQGTQSKDGGERWQPSKESSDGVLNIKEPDSHYGADQMEACWSEKRHFGIKKNGYHGGVSPQEMVAPCFVMTQMDINIKGWDEIPISAPLWWTTESHKPSDSFTSKVSEAEQSIPETSNWVDELIQSPTFVSSCKQAGRRRPSNEQIVMFLIGMYSANGHQKSENELASLLEIPSLRIRGFVTQVSRILNIEGYQVVEYTTDGNHIKLNMSLLQQQFGLEV